MKKLLYFITFFCIASVAKAQTVPSSCTASPNVVKQYADDADFMAEQRILSIGNTYQDSINIPQLWADTALRAMIAVFNATTLPARDSVASIYRIHEYANFTTHSLFINADSNETYMKQLKQNILPTGDPTFDNLIALYPISTFSYLPFGTDSNHQVYLQFDSTYNTPVLADEFTVLHDVQSVMGTYTVFGDSDHIAYDVTANYVELRYTHGWQNCMDQNGCDKQHTWTFHVSYNCDVTYIGSSGDPLHPVNSVKDVAANNIKVYPNPASDVLHIESINTVAGSYRIYNMQGVQLANSNITTAGINISNLPTGNYIIQLQNGDNSFYSKFQKQ